MAESTRATREQLEALHGQLTRVFSKYLKAGDYSAPMLNVIRCFLLNNGIVKDLTQVNQVRDCSKNRPGLAPLCSSYQLRKSRYGHELGRSIQKKDYRIELTEVSNFLEQYHDHPAVISALAFFQNWIDQAAKDEAEVGKAIFGRLYRQGIQPLNLLTEVSAVWMFAEKYPHQLPDDLRLTYSLSRNAARLAGLERKSYGQSTGMRHPKPAELKTTGEHIRQSLARFFVNLSVALNAKADQVMCTKQNLSIPFI